LAVALFDQTRSVHGLTDREREWLEYAALSTISASTSAKAIKALHYLIKNGDLRGFEPTETVYGAGGALPPQQHTEKVTRRMKI
jgi:hypothetical protein